MKNYLMREGYWKVVTGEISTTSETGQTTDGQFAEIDEKALIDICISVNGTQIIYVQDADSGKEAWDALLSVYEKDGVAHKMHLIDRLSTTKLRLSDSAKGKNLEEMR